MHRLEVAMLVPRIDATFLGAENFRMSNRRLATLLVALFEMGTSGEVHENNEPEATRGMIRSMM